MGLYPHKTVEANMGFPLKLRKMNKAEVKRQVASAVEISMRVAWRKFRFLRGISGPSCVLSEVMVIEGFGGFL